MMVAGTHVALWLSSHETLQNIITTNIKNIVKYKQKVHIWLPNRRIPLTVLVPLRVNITNSAHSHCRGSITDPTDIMA